MQLDPAGALAVEDRLVAAHERVNADLAVLFDLIVEFDRREAYLVDGARNMPDWLCFRFGYSERRAITTASRMHCSTCRRSTRCGVVAC